MPQDPERIEAMLRRMRAMREEYGAAAEGLRECGLEVDGFLADCDEFIAVLEGRHDGEFDVKDFLRRLGAFTEEAKEFMHIQQQVKAVEFAGDLHDFLPEMEKMVAEFRAHGGATEVRAAAEIEASLKRFKEGLAEGRLDQDAFEDMQLGLSMQMAELKRRNRFRTATCFLYWESWPPERWAKLTPEERVKMENNLEKWKSGKEEYLGTLPLEDRRRLEAMRYEDFDRPGACEP